MHKKQAKKAFSLIELSIVILIVSILITGSLGASKTAINNGKSKITNERMDEIYKALTNFVATNRRLPCPALLTTVKGVATYGIEATTPGTCTGTFTSTNATNLVYGMIPTIALGLSPDMAEDGFGTKFSYVVDKRFTSATTFDSTVATSQDTATEPTIIKIQGPFGTDILTNALFTLTSHGSNSYCGFNATGIAQNNTSLAIIDTTTNPSTDEVDNSYNDCKTGSSSFNNTFISYSTNSYFDDVVLYKSKTQLIMDAGLEMVTCVSGEISSSTPPSTSTSYGCYACSNSMTKKYYCGKYGIWSSGITVTSCTASC